MALIEFQDRPCGLSGSATPPTFDVAIPWPDHPSPLGTHLAPPSPGKVICRTALDPSQVARPKPCGLHQPVQSRATQV